MWNPFGSGREPANDDLLARVQKLESSIVQLRLEWTEVLDKVLHRLQRQAKRDRDAVLRAGEGPQEANGPVVGTDAPRGSPEFKKALYARLRGQHVRG